MSVLTHEINIRRDMREANVSLAQESFIKEAIAKAFWLWYYGHQNDVVIKKLFFITVRVHHLKPFFMLLFGPSPEVIA